MAILHGVAIFKEKESLYPERQQPAENLVQIFEAVVEGMEAFFRKFSKPLPE